MKRNKKYGQTQNEKSGFEKNKKTLNFTTSELPSEIAVFLFDNEKYCDIKVKTKSRTFHVLSAIVCSQSVVFQMSLMDHQMKENKEKTLDFTNDDEDDDQVIYSAFKFIHTGIFEIEPHILEFVFQFAHKYQIQSLLEALFKQSPTFINSMDDRNVVSLYSTLHLLFSQESTSSQSPNTSNISDKLDISTSSSTLDSSGKRWENLISHCIGRCYNLSNSHFDPLIFQDLKFDALTYLLQKSSFDITKKLRIQLAWLSVDEKRGKYAKQLYNEDEKKNNQYVAQQGRSCHYCGRNYYY